jgi:monoamine oxidase
MIERRPLLAALLATTISPTMARCAAPPRGTVAIIGAGMAGLAAAVDLRAAGFGVIILEARDRIGGRIHTSHAWPDLPIDLGASWIHGTKGNPVTALAKAAGAATVTTSYDSAALHVDPALAALGVDDAAEDEMEALFNRAMRRARRNGTDMSVQDAIEAFAATLSPARRAQLDFYLSSHYEQEYGGGTPYLSARTIDDNDVFPGEDALFPGGYEQITRHLAKGLDIRLGKVVTRVRREPGQVRISLQDGTELTAEHLLVTAPLGVLKSGSIAFDPPLPPAKQQAIDRLGMGLLNKHWLRFDRIFWPKEFDWHEYLSAEKGRWSEWVSLAKVDDAPLLLVFSAAERASRVEAMSDAEIVRDAMQVVRAMFGPDAPDPVAAQITRWSADPFARGSYSFNAVGSSNADREALAENDTGRLHFAGEALNALYPGTVHGALLSGRRAARTIIKDKTPHD